MLEKLCSECEASEKDPERRVENAIIKNLGFWLFTNLMVINGSRRQAAVHFFTNGARQRANVEGSTYYFLVHLFSNEDLQDHHIVQFVIGGDKVAQMGKTSADIELAVPKDLVIGMVFFYTIKEHMGLVRPEGPFFVDIENKAVSANKFYATVCTKQCVRK
jgi:hypothetical protein